ncbi:hypothetical protein ACFPRL_30480 [Pseudoclavibacter helvolus]
MESWTSSEASSRSRRPSVGGSQGAGTRPSRVTRSSRTMPAAWSSAFQRCPASPRRPRRSHRSARSSRPPCGSLSVLVRVTGSSTSTTRSTSTRGRQRTSSCVASGSGRTSRWGASCDLASTNRRHLVPRLRGRLRPSRRALHRQGRHQRMVGRC